MFDLAEMEELLGRSRGRRGLRPLRRVLAIYREVPMTRSELERRFLRLCESAGLPRPLVNTSIAGIEVDMYWPDARLAVELDSWEYHRTRSAFERDRERDDALQGTGIQVRRLTDRRLKRDADGVFANLRTALAIE